MLDKNLGKRCTYAEKCPVYKGITEANGMPLHIHRNVFCNRGIRGWNNCEQFKVYKLKA